MQGASVAMSTALVGLSQIDAAANRLTAPESEDAAPLSSEVVDNADMVDKLGSLVGDLAADSE